MPFTIDELIYLIYHSNMVRPLRIQYEGAFYHVISRGNAGRYLYMSGEDRDYFVRLLGRGAKKYEVEVYAYCVMGTHYHLLIQTIKANLSDFMHFLGSSYGSFITRKGVIGHVFAGRYKAICIQREEYFLTVSRYIHLNPVEAKIAGKPGDYRWSSYSLFVDNRRIPAWLNQDWLLEYFGPGAGEAKSRYKEFIESVCDDPPPYPHEDVVAQTILGNEEFVKTIKSIVNKETKPAEVTGKKRLARPLTLKEMHDAVCSYYGLSDLTGCDGDRKQLNRQVRKSFVYLARENTPASNKEISELLLDITSNGVSRQYSRMKKALEVDESLRDRFAGEVSKIMSHVRG
jgi:REP element-mobilizing transposase RayT